MSSFEWHHWFQEQYTQIYTCKHVADCRKNYVLKNILWIYFTQWHNFMVFNQLLIVEKFWNCVLIKSMAYSISIQFKCNLAISQNVRDSASSLGNTQLYFWKTLKDSCLKFSSWFQILILQVIFLQKRNLSIFSANSYMNISTSQGDHWYSLLKF